MIDLDAASTPNERLALELLKAMEDGTLPDALPRLCSEDFVWANSGLPTLSGLAEVFAHMEKGGFANEIPILKTMASFSADLLHIASAGAVEMLKDSC